MTPNRVYWMTYLSIHDRYWNNLKQQAILHSIDYRFLAVGMYSEKGIVATSDIGSDRHGPHVLYNLW